MHVPESPLRYEFKVPSSGKIELQLSSLAGTQVTVYVVEQRTGQRDEHLTDDFLSAAISSTDFWDNPEDDEDWNNA
jgi:hypothetical protein